VSLDNGAEGLGLVQGRIKGTVAAAVDVVDVLANDLPVIRPKLVLADDLVGSGKTIEDEPKEVELVL
jgi:hypothetical protein